LIREPEDLPGGEVKAAPDGKGSSIDAMGLPFFIGFRLALKAKKSPFEKGEFREIAGGYKSPLPPFRKGGCFSNSSFPPGGC
jgi:hypothetical protein